METSHRHAMLACHAFLLATECLFCLPRNMLTRVLRRTATTSCIANVSLSQCLLRTQVTMSRGGYKTVCSDLIKDLHTVHTSRQIGCTFRNTWRLKFQLSDLAPVPRHACTRPTAKQDSVLVYLWCVYYAFPELFERA